MFQIHCHKHFTQMVLVRFFGKKGLNKLSQEIRMLKRVFFVNNVFKKRSTLTVKGHYDNVVWVFSIVIQNLNGNFSRGGVGNAG